MHYLKTIYIHIQKNDEMLTNVTRRNVYGKIVFWVLRPNLQICNRLFSFLNAQFLVARFFCCMKLLFKKHSLDVSCKYYLRLLPVFPVWIRNWLLSVGLEPVLSHTEKLCIASYYWQFSTKITKSIPVLLARAFSL